MTPPDTRLELARQFRNQARFADGYSPLYADLFAIVAGWLAAGPDDPVVAWLVDAAAERRPFDVTLLLMAALHRDVLAGEPAAVELGRYFPTAGHGRQATDGAKGDQFAARGLQSVSPLPDALREAILARRDALGAFIRRANVQTNETGRGLVWLLPVAWLGWPAVHLIELGASAGLNLVAEQRGFRVVDAADPARELLSLGNGPPQFATLARGAAPILQPPCCPTVLSRAGGDMFPFHLRSREDELTLAAYVWGDQPERLARLREGIAALRAVEKTTAPVTLHPLRLPDELPGFLAAVRPRSIRAPVVLFNTTMTMYLPDRGASMRDLIAAWAAQLDAPVLWLQWEPAWGGPEPPEKEWLAWTADYWPNDAQGEAYHQRLAWVHPHGVALQWEPDWELFRARCLK